MHLSDIFKFTQGLGQKGHQIGRKVGDAMELLTLGMVNLSPNLTDFLIVEDGVEGATTAKHKVEFSFYNLESKLPSKKSEDLFGIIECKKVGVEQTIKQNFKRWKARPENTGDFFKTNGYTFTSSPTGTNYKWSISVNSISDNENNLKITTRKVQSGTEDIVKNYLFSCTVNSQVLIVVDMQNNLHVLGPSQILSEIEHSIRKCIIVQIKQLENYQIKSIHVNESLRGPQTPEKAKQASFVSLDVRKKVLGRFDKSDNKSFISILVIGEASHWENKSRAMVRLCNDYNLIIPDKVLVYLFSKFQEKFGDNYQTVITKTNYRINEEVRTLISEIITFFDKKILMDMDTTNFVHFEHIKIGQENRLIVKELQG